jgi:hypothetical protein
MLILNLKYTICNSKSSIGIKYLFSSASMSRHDTCVFRVSYWFLVSAKFSLSHAAISAPRSLEFEALLGSL